MFGFPVAARDVSALSLRPDHAPRLEGADPGDAGLAAGRGLSWSISTSVRGRGTRNARRTQFLQDLPAAGSCCRACGSRCKHAVPAQDHHQLPGGEDPAERALPRPACAAPLSERRGALHRLQAVRGGVPGARDHDRIGRRPRRHAPHDALRHRPVQVHLLRLLRGGLPGGCDRRDAAARIPHGEPRREHHEQGQAARRRRALRGDDRRRQAPPTRGTDDVPDDPVLSSSRPCWWAPPSA